MISMKDYEDAEGTVDWKAFNKAREEAGEKCTRCGASLLLVGILGGGRPTGPTLCGACRSMDEDAEEVNHSKAVRCPRCGIRETIEEGELYSLYEEGEHDVYCNHCEFEYEVTTYVQYTFTSPARTSEESDV